MRRRGTPCTVCALNAGERTRLETLRCSGVSLDILAKRFRVGRDAVWRHMRTCVSAEMKIQYLAGPVTIERLREKAAEENLSVIEYLGIARSMIVGQMTASSEAGDGYRVATLSGRLVEILREIGRITGEVEKLGGALIVNNNISIMADPRMVNLQTGLVRISREFPEARSAIVGLLRDLDAKPDARPAPPSSPLIEHEGAARV